MSDSYGEPRVPRLAELLFKLLTPARERGFVLGDLAEEFTRMVRAGSSPNRARAWYWRQLIGSVLPRVIRLIRPKSRRPETDGRRLDRMWQDLRFAVRTSLRRPVFALVVTLTLGLGIGAATVVFSVADAVVLRALPFVDADRLVRLQEANPQGDPYSISAPNFLDFRERSRSFSQLVAFTVGGMTLIGSGDPIQVTGMPVSEGFFEMLEAQPEMGRSFAPDDFGVATEGDVVVLSHRFWESQFGASPSTLGTSINVDGTPRTLVGVMSADFVSPVGADLWVPFGPDPGFERGDHRLEALGRLADGVSLEQASADLQGVAAQLGERFPLSNDGWSVWLRTFPEWMIGRDVRRTVVVLLGAVGLLLLLACTSVSNLLVARATGRQREMALRVALGAERGRVVGQLLVESGLLAAIGAVIGVGAARLVLPLIQRFNVDALPRMTEISIDARVLAMAVGLTIITTLVSGLAPALHGTRRDLLREMGGASEVSRSFRVRDALVTLQFALALMLLVGGGLLLGSFVELQRVDPGFDPAGVLTATIIPRPDRYPEMSPQTATFFRDVLVEIEAIPGVEAAGASMVSPYRGPRPSNRVGAEGRFTEIDEMVEIQWRAVTPGFFAAMGVPLVRGRLLDDTDYDLGLRAAESGDAPPFSVVIGASLADLLWPEVDPLGKRLLWNLPGGQPMTVVGVVENIRDIALDADAVPTVFLPHALVAWPQMALIVRSESGTSALAVAIRQAVWSVDADTPVPSVEVLSRTMELEVSGPRMNMQLVMSFSFSALMLAAMGLYGIISFAVTQRTREIGIRLALGARRRAMVSMVFEHGGRLLAAGTVLGLAGAVALSRFMEGVLYDVEPTDPRVYVVMTLVLAVVAGIAMYLPARRATRIDPKVAFSAD